MRDGKPPQAHIQRQSRRDFPVVLEERLDLVVSVAPGALNIQLGIGIGPAEQEIRNGVSGERSTKVELPLSRTEGVLVFDLPLVLAAHLQTVAPATYPNVSDHVYT